MSEKYNPEEDGGADFPIDPVRPRAFNIHSHSGQLMHPTAYGCPHKVNHEEAPKPDVLRKQRSCMHDSATQLSRFPNSVLVQGSSRFGIGGDFSVNSQWTEDSFSNNQYSHMADGESKLLGGPNTSHKKASAPLRKDLMVKTTDK